MNNNVLDLIYVNTKSLSQELCNDMINMFESSNQRHPGVTFSGLNKNIKSTTDLLISKSGCGEWDRINKTLYKELDYNVQEFSKKYGRKINDIYNVFSTDYIFTESLQMQKYDKNIGKYVYHHDYSCDVSTNKMRQLTFIWYLNDVIDGGETEFWGQYEVKPEAGKLVLFPASWTFPHCGKMPISSDKYIVTGWLWENIEDNKKN